MDKNGKNNVKNPKEGANLLSLLSFSWLMKTFLLGYKRDLEESDICLPLAEHESSILGDKIEKQWKKNEEETKKSGGEKRPSLLKILFRCFGTKFMVTGLVQAVEELVLRVSIPIFLAKMMNYFSPKKNIEKAEAMYWALGLIICTFILSVVAHHIMYSLIRVGISMNVACSSLIYRKILRISQTAMDENTTVGQMTNLLSHDVTKFDHVAFDVHYLWIGPIQTIIVTCVMYQYVDWAALIGMFTLLLFFPFHACFGKLTSTSIPKQVYKTDDRLRLMNEIIRAIQVIKMYAWEKPFCSLVEKSRKKESQAIRRVNILFHMSFSLQLYVPKICLFISIASYVYFGNTITVEKVYLMMAFYNVLQHSIFHNFPMGIQSVVGCIVAARRIENFMQLKELPSPPVEIQSNGKNKSALPKDVAVSFHQASAKWSEESEEDTLKNIHFNVKPGLLVAVIGKIGSGKTSILQALLRELPLRTGNVSVNGKIAYTCQESWIFASSIRQNILFGNPMDEYKYEKVIEVCQLRRDLSLFPYGDKTVVGDRGISLSGGQRARINLARAVYSQADVYLFDDPLSAVDAEVGRSIFNECFKSFLKDKTIILVTHQLQYLRFVDRILVLDEGKILVEGTFDQLQNSRINISKYMHIEQVDEESSFYETRDKKTETFVAPTVTEDPDENEMRTYGKIALETYMAYFKAVNNFTLVTLMLFLHVFCKITSQGSDYFVAFWVNNVETAQNDTLVKSESDWYVIWYGSIIILNVFSNIFVIVVFYEVCIRASKNFHNRMFNNVCRATMRFFNVNPTGRIMNRFSRDIDIIDVEIPYSLFDVLEIGTSFILTIIIVIVINPWLVISSMVMMLIIFLMRTFYIRTSRSIKRLEAITRSPMFNHLSATVQGVTTIRAFNAQNNLIREFDNHQDFHTSAWFIFRSCSRAFGMYIDFICTFYVSVTIVLFLLLDDVAPPGDVGLVISQSMLLLNMVQWGVRQTTELENQMTSVERVLEYSKLEEEPPFDSSPENRPPKDWPFKGHIQFKNMYLMYSPESAAVLQNVNIAIMPKEKIGIVGRSGAGKSSLITALFRLAYMKGEIYIDDVPISQLGVHDLRPKISIIPQEPVLFAGSLRKNLDPFDEYSDNILWQALENVEMKEFVENMAGGLYTKISEGGRNFSSGQRQLFCLARTVVKENKILILDEATANVDLQTDELIQRTVRKNFAHCTVLTVAHRLNTIMDSDRVLVVDAGTMVEFDHPHVLLQNGNGYFSKLVHQSGSATAKKLLVIAENSYNEKKLE